MRLVLVYVLGTVAAASLVAQQSAPVFRAGVEVVEVHAVVTDRNGQPVEGLTADDFELREDRRVQQIVTFGATRVPFAPLPGDAFAALPFPSDVRSNLEEAGRVFALVLDGLHVEQARTGAVQAAAREFVERGLGRGDLAQVVLTADGGSVLPPFTSSRPSLLANVSRFNGAALLPAPPPPSLTSIRDQEPADALPSVAGQDPQDDERARRTEAMLETVRRVAEAAGTTRGRRVSLVLVSEGIDAEAQPGSRAARALAERLRQATEAAVRANVAIYTVDPRALVRIQERRSPAQLGAAREMLENLAEQTGGVAMLSPTTAGAVIERIGRDASSYYVLGYTPAASRDAKVRRIEVRVKRPGVQVRARRGYLAQGDSRVAAESGVRAVRDALNSAVPQAAMPMLLFAAPFSGGADRHAVIVCFEWPAGEGNFAVRSGGVNTMEIEAVAIDPTGRIGNSAHHTAVLTFEPTSVDGIRRSGLRLMSQLALAPGRYQLRIAAAEAIGGTAGSVVYDLDVPDFARMPLSMSGVALYSWPEAPAQLTAGADAPASGILPFPPTLRRTFTRADELHLFAEIYETRTPAPEHQLEFRATLLSLDGRVVTEDRTTWSSLDARGHRNEYGVQAKLRLANANPGTYLVRVEGRSAVGGDAVTRTIPIRVTD